MSELVSRRLSLFSLFWRSISFNSPGLVCWCLCARQSFGSNWPDPADFVWAVLARRRAPRSSSRLSPPAPAPSRLGSPPGQLIQQLLFQTARFLVGQLIRWWYPGGRLAWMGSQAVLLLMEMPRWWPSQLSCWPGCRLDGRCWLTVWTGRVFYYSSWKWSEIIIQKWYDYRQKIYLFLMTDWKKIQLFLALHKITDQKLTFLNA